MASVWALRAQKTSGGGFPLQTVRDSVARGAVKLTIKAMRRGTDQDASQELH
jgi:hypothetical protein